MINPKIIDATPRVTSEYARVIDALGTEGFGVQYTNLILSNSDASFISAIQVLNSRARVLSVAAADKSDIANQHANRYVEEARWRHDPAFRTGSIQCKKDSLEILQIDRNTIDDEILRCDFFGSANISDKISIISRKDDSLYLIHLLRTKDRGLFSKHVMEWLSDEAESLVALLSKHVSICFNSPAQNYLANQFVIEERLLKAEELDPAWRLTRRERDVCVRILLGGTTAGIAADLEVSEYTVETYRKRAYRRLNIATKHELLRQYLSLNF